jgi:pimeloyl-ACP methyl ester carboxylesterase
VVKEQYGLGRTPGFLDAQLAAVRAQVGLRGQREVLLDRLPHPEIPTPVVWGARNRVFPKSPAQDATARLRKGSLELIPDCGHLMHAERSDLFVAALERFLGGPADH